MNIKLQKSQLRDLDCGCSFRCPKLGLRFRIEDALIDEGLVIAEALEPGEVAVALSEHGERRFPFVEGVRFAFPEDETVTDIEPGESVDDILDRWGVASIEDRQAE